MLPKQLNLVCKGVPIYKPMGNPLETWTGSINILHFVACEPVMHVYEEAGERKHVECCRVHLTSGVITVAMSAQQFMDNLVAWAKEYLSSMPRIVGG